jgi:hypothetical protein
MPIVQVTKEQIRRRGGRINLAKCRATTEADIQRQQRDDGMDDTATPPVVLARSRR